MTFTFTPEILVPMLACAFSLGFLIRSIMRDKDLEEETRRSDRFLALAEQAVEEKMRLEGILIEQGDGWKLAGMEEEE